LVGSDAAGCFPILILICFSCLRIATPNRPSKIPSEDSPRNSGTCG
jgi:hypothetical protein